MKYSLSFFLLAILSTASYFAFSTPYVSDFVYSLRAPMSGDKICENRHFYPLNDRLDSLTGEVSLIYDYDNQQSRDVESVYFRIKDELSFESYTRYPAVLDSNFTDAAIWGEALTQTKMAEKAPDLILKSYDVFLNKGVDSRRSFNDEFSTLKVDSDIFYRIVAENDFSEYLAGHMQRLYDISPKMIPLVVVKGKYLVYPSFFKDIRDGWMIVDYLYNNTDERIASSCKN